MKRVSVVLLVGLLIGMLTVSVGAATLKIGICKIVEHPALDAVEQGTIDALAAAEMVNGFLKDVSGLLRIRTAGSLRRSGLLRG